MAVVGRIQMETVTELREDPLEEIAESSWLAKAGYDWVAVDVRNQSSLFRWSRLLNSWLNCTPIIARGVDRGIVSLERVSAVERVCHGQEGAVDKIFYMYMCHFLQLHVRLPLDDFAMGVLRLLNVAPTQLHPNSWAYFQAFCVLCQSLYLQPSPLAFLYFYDMRPRQPTKWLSLVSRPSISMLDAFTQSFKHFKDEFFRVVVKEGGRSYFLNAYGSTKFPFSWTGNPWQYKDMSTNELSAADKEVVELLMKFTDKLPTKGLIRIYNSLHPIIYIEGLRKEKAVKVKEAGNTEVPNLHESLVEVHVHGDTKRKPELSARPSRGKDVKKGPKVGMIELSKTTVRKDIEINLSETLINSIDSMEPDHLVRTMVEFGSKALILGRRVGSLYRRELREGNHEKLQDLQGKVDKFAVKKAAWEKEREEWKEEKRRLGTWKVWCLD
ncbi:hypothetical protein DEO72_LG3g1955 [Vigna unguiculata]|uniref:Transposase (putative) gypsy type domain-containing protein n=1 Tax=Vigna unguiculata TaxID=3917 RepID=A0A4D6LFI9_VIGUN|nr:hypothetical protein DEO72_LG3g1955 [Vigna unguiculata]